MSGTQRSLGALARGLIVLAIAAAVLGVAYFVINDPGSPRAVIARSYAAPVVAHKGPVLKLGRGHAAMAAGPAGLWVVRAAPTGALGRLIQIDTGTGEAKQVHRLPIIPASVAVGTNVVWVLGTKPGSALAVLLRVDPANGRVTASAQLAEPPACATSVFASCYPVATGDGVWVPLIDRIVHVPASGTIADQTIPLGGHVWDLVSGDHQLWVLAEVALYRLDERTGHPTARLSLTPTLGPGLQSNHIAVGNDRIWISSFPRQGSNPAGRITELTPGGAMPQVVQSRIYPGAGSLALIGGGLWLDRYDGQGELDRLDAATGALTGPFVVVPDDVTAIAVVQGDLWILSYRPTGNERTVAQVALTPTSAH